MSFTCPNGHSSSADDYCDTCGAAIDASAQLTPEPVAAQPDPSGLTVESSATAEASAGAHCPNCGTDNVPDSLFCEACGYDFTTGALPRGVAPAAGMPLAPPEPTAAASEGEASAAAAEQAPPAAAQVAPPATAQAEQPATAGEQEAAAAAPAAPGAAIAEASGAATDIPPAIPLQWVAEVWIDPEWYEVQEADDPMPSPGLPTVVPLTVRSALIGRVSESRGIHPDIDCTTDSSVSRKHAQLTTDGTRWFVEDLDSSNGTFVGSIDEPLPEDPIPVGPKRELDTDDRIYVGAWTRIVVRKATDEEIAAAAGS